MIDGAHIIIYSKHAEADRAFFRDILKFKNVDAGQGWLIFKLPPAEVAVHPADEINTHQLYLMCENLDAEMAHLKKAGIACEPPSQQGWGVLTHIHLPGGGKLGLYQPRHKRP
jgi:catechol 2,3-dioxygenase-like lactoylglutathione lyase family enzyme